MSLKIDKVKDPPKLVITFANTLFVLGIVSAILLSIYAVYKIYSPLSYTTNTFYYLCILFSGISATLFGFGLKLNNNLKVNLSVLIITIGISFYAYEIYLEYSDIEISKKLIDQSETKTLKEVFEDLNDSGVDTYRNFLPAYLIQSNGLTNEYGGIYPLGGISNITTLLHNESGYYPIIETDERGFNNSKGLYNKNKIDIMLIGDSFIEGYSVRHNETISAVIRESDYNAISLGKGGNGPLINFATLIEYAKPLQPKIVLWFFYFNDLSDLNIEMSSSFLKKYLNEDGFSQNLISRQNEIDNVLVNYIQEEKEKEEIKGKETKTKRSLERSIQILKLSNFRLKMNLYPNPLLPLEFNNILEKSNKVVSGWGGKLYFIYLPSYYRYSTILSNPFKKYLNFIYSVNLDPYENILRTVTELDIPIIDIHKEVFEPHPDPLSLFPFREIGHYTAEGYRLIAENIIKILKNKEEFIMRFE